MVAPTASQNFGALEPQETAFSTSLESLNCLAHILRFIYSNECSKSDMTLICTLHHTHTHTHITTHTYTHTTHTQHTHYTHTLHTRTHIPPLKFCWNLALSNILAITMCLFLIAMFCAVIPCDVLWWISAPYHGG